MIQRWSLQSLSQHVTSHTGAQALVEDVARRLARQVTFCKDLLGPQVRTSNCREHICKDFDHLLYIHNDTHRLCTQLADQSRVYSRWNQADQHLLSSTLAQVRNRHATTIERWVDMVNQDRALQDNILTILRGRLGIQLLCDHAVQQIDRRKTHGAVTLDCSIRDCIDDAYAEAKFLCDAHWQVTPELELVGADDDVRLTCIRPWLVHALVELFKNAMNASVCELGNDAALGPPPIQIDISVDDKLTRIDVHDQGKGLPVDVPSSGKGMKSALFGLGLSSSDKKWDRIDEQQSYATVRSPLSSLGVGLPVSRMMMEHFGGTVTLQPANDGPGAMASIFLANDTTLVEKPPEEE